MYCITIARGAAVVAGAGSVLGVLEGAVDVELVSSGDLVQRRATAYSHDSRVLCCRWSGIGTPPALIALCAGWLFCPPSFKIVTAHEIVSSGIVLVLAASLQEKTGHGLNFLRCGIRGHARHAVGFRPVIRHCPHSA